MRRSGEEEHQTLPAHPWLAQTILSVKGWTPRNHLHRVWKEGTATMSLAAQAGQARAMAIAGTTEAQARKDAAIMAEIKERLDDYFGVESVILGAEHGDHPVQRRGTWGDTLGRARHTVYRFQVDDIVVRWEMDLSSSSPTWRNGRFCVEVSCSDCTQPTSSEYIFTSGEFADPNDEKRLHNYDYARTEEMRARFLRQIGERLDKPRRCWDCAVGVPDSCPTCGRSNR